MLILLPKDIEDETTGLEQVRIKNSTDKMLVKKLNNKESYVEGNQN